jgi:hypothetical protein
VKLLPGVSNVGGLVVFDHFPYKKIPVSDQNLHKNIFWRKTGQCLVGDTMKGKKWSWWQQWLQTLLEWARNGTVGGGW